MDPHPLIRRWRGLGRPVRIGPGGGDALLAGIPPGGRKGAALPLGDANARALGSARTPAGGIPVVLCLCGSDPQHSAESLVEGARASGAEGIFAWPSVALHAGAFRKSLEEGGLGIETEARLLMKAREAGLLSMAAAATKSDLEYWLAEKPDVVVLLGALAVPEGAEPMLLRLRENVRVSDPESTLSLE
jgi:hypothetical protein